ncbi:hypothetical protein HK101_006327, partial [Irineochytrium annulatum]
KLSKVAQRIRQSNLVRDLQVIRHARVPILKFRDVETGIDVDVSYTTNRNPGSVRAVRFVRDLMLALPGMRELVLVLKQFLVVRGLSEVFTGGVGGYACSLWIACHLAMQGGGGGCHRRKPMTQDLGELWTSFCRVFGTSWNYHDKGLTLTLVGGTGGTVAVREVDKAREGFLIHERPHLLCILDPLDPSADVTRGSTGIMAVSSALADAWEIMGGKVRAGRGWCVGFGAQQGLGRVLCVAKEHMRRRDEIGRCAKGGEKAVEMEDVEVVEETGEGERPEVFFEGIMMEDNGEEVFSSEGDDEDDDDVVEINPIAFDVLADKGLPLTARHVKAITAPLAPAQRRVRVGFNGRDKAYRRAANSNAGWGKLKRSVPGANAATQVLAVNCSFGEEKGAAGRKNVGKRNEGGDFHKVIVSRRRLREVVQAPEPCQATKRTISRTGGKRSGPRSMVALPRRGAADRADMRMGVVDDGKVGKSRGGRAGSRGVKDVEPSFGQNRAKVGRGGATRARGGAVVRSRR